MAHPHLTLQLETGITKVTREQAMDAIQYGFCADNVLKWVFCAIIGIRIRNGYSTGRRMEPKMKRMALALCKQGCDKVLDCRVSSWAR